MSVTKDEQYIKSLPPTERAARKQTPSLVRKIEVLHSRATRGAGTDEDPCRFVDQYWDSEGNLLAENDPC